MINRGYLIYTALIRVIMLTNPFTKIVTGYSFGNIFKEVGRGAIKGMTKSEHGFF